MPTQEHGKPAECSIINELKLISYIAQDLKFMASPGTPFYWMAK